jgi:hypothetical protein
VNANRPAFVKFLAQPFGTREKLPGYAHRN